MTGWGGDGLGVVTDWRGDGLAWIGRRWLAWVPLFAVEGEVALPGG
jgi:hypothetical protein